MTPITRSSGGTAVAAHPLRISRSILPEAPWTSFTRPIVIFLSHRNDAAGAHPFFAVLDPLSLEMTFVSSLPDEFNDSGLDDDGHPLPHSAISCGTDRGFYAFPFGSARQPWFYHVDYPHGKLRLIPAGSLAGRSSSIIADGVGSTLSLDPADPSRFFATLRVPSDSTTTTCTIRYYSTALDLSSANEVFRRECRADDQCPHATQRVGAYLLGSEFDADEFRLLRNGRRYSGIQDLIRHVAQDSSADPRWQWLRDALQSHTSFGAPLITRFVQQAQTSRYRFTLASGVVRVLALAEREEHVVDLESSKPAHFQIGSDGAVYISCHNLFCENQRNYFIGPGSIIKMRLHAGSLQIEAGFSDPSGFRFSSHAVFQRDGREYVATMGYPNRLFLLDAGTMELLHWRDMGEPLPSCCFQSGCIIGAPELERYATKALCVSADGKYLMVPNRNDLIVIDTQTLDIVAELNIVQPLAKLAACDPEDIENEALHFGLL